MLRKKDTILQTLEGEQNLSGVYYQQPAPQLPKMLWNPFMQKFFSDGFKSRIRNLYNKLNSSR